MDNKYTGETPVRIGGKDYTLVFTGRAIALLRSNFEEQKVEMALRDLDMERIAMILEAGLKKHHPDMTAAKILDEVVPMVPAIQAISRALRYATDGLDTPVPALEEVEQGPPA